MSALSSAQREKLANWIIQRLENLSDQDIRAVAKRVIELRRGHPGRAKKWGGTDGLAAVQVRLSGAAFTSLENWRRSQQKIPARSEALRFLVERALAEDDRPSGEAGA